MKNLKLILFSVLLCCSASLVAQQLSTEKIAALQKIIHTIKDTTDNKRAGVQVSILRNGELTTFCSGYSYDTVKITKDHIFNIASTTKLITATLIMQEVEKGTLSLTDSLGKFFPKEWITNEHVDLTITVYNLLTHTSGLGRLVNSVKDQNEALLNPFYKYNRDFNYNFILKKQLI